MCEEIDSDHIDHMQEQGLDPSVDPFFIFEGSLKILCKYLQKLSKWFNETIFLFYFQILNLYYFTDVERTRNELL